MAFRIEFNAPSSMDQMVMEDVIDPDLSVFHIAGYVGHAPYESTKQVLRSLETLFPTKYQVATHEFPSQAAYEEFIYERQTKLPDPRCQGFIGCPFVCIGADLKGNPAGCEFVGSDADTLDRVRTLFGGKTFAPSVVPAPDGYVKDHPYEFDLVVIGGGSGGLAASKEAAKLGARVAVLDYVKPSPHGTTWGLGGTCVNVGCIPKKLMHQASIIGEQMKHDAARFGWLIPAADDETDAPQPQHFWGTMLEQVQQYIKALNFKYRVALRDADVKYFNALGEFVGPHELKCTEFKGKKKTPKEKTITSARFLIATGGRPTPLTCPGGEFAITSDDLFSFPRNPGKTCIVGAGYVALECGGFLKALGCDVTILVRSILLRGFDRECCDKIGDHMRKIGISIVMKVTPASIEKQANGQLKVTYSDGNFGIFDTVICAVGRHADTAGLNLEAAGGVITERNGKFPADNEQTNVPHIYAIGDVLQGKPELTPVAIQAGLMLARRLFADSNKAMDYVNIATAVFTPLEYGACGLSEEAATEEYGASNIEVYHSTFSPLEWNLTPERDPDSNPGFCKVVCDKNSNEKVIGMHYLGPNAGEVMQGFGAAIKSGISMDELKETVGIHPTTAENFTVLSVTKSSGCSAAASSC